MSGHVFVCHSDITRLRCDAWLLPSDGNLGITKGWFELAPRNASDALRSPALRDQWERRSSRALAVDAWYPPLKFAPAPVPIITDVGAWSGQGLGWYLEGLSDFIEAALALPGQARRWRIRPLFAVPLIGTGAGGQEAKKGPMERAILEKLETAAKLHDADFVLVLSTRAAYAAAQAVRRDDVQWPLDNRQRKRLDDLAERANRGELVLFIGAGLSRSAGLPLWGELLDQLAEAVGEGPKEISALKRLPPLDAAAILDRRSRRKGRLKEEAARLTTTACFGLGHALAAAIPVKERVTTNYDECIESSLKATGATPSVLPYRPIRSQGSWLLKLHGTIGVPKQIVLTRQDYIRYENGRGALYGIVQAMMLTRHILFLGFSLADENFNELVDEVRRALDGLSRRKPADRFGTAFVPTENSTAAELWDREMFIEQIGNKESYPCDLEIALDYLAMKTTSAIPHLLDDSYEEILTDEQRRLKTVVRQLRDGLDEADIASHSFAPVRKLLADLGDSCSAIRNSDRVGHARERR